MVFLISLMSIGDGCLYLLLIEKSETIVHSISGIINAVFIIFLIELIYSPFVDFLKTSYMGCNRPYY